MRCLLLVPQCFEQKNLLNEGRFAAQEWPCLSAKTTLRLNPWACKAKNIKRKTKAFNAVKLAKITCAMPHVGKRIVLLASNGHRL